MRADIGPPSLALTVYPQDRNEIVLGSRTSHPASHPNFRRTHVERRIQLQFVAFP